MLVDSWTQDLQSDRCFMVIWTRVIHSWKPILNQPVGSGTRGCWALQSRLRDQVFYCDAFSICRDQDETNSISSHKPALPKAYLGLGKNIENWGSWFIKFDAKSRALKDIVLKTTVPNDQKHHHHDHHHHQHYYASLCINTIQIIIITQYHHTCQTKSDQETTSSVSIIVIMGSDDVMELGWCSQPKFHERLAKAGYFRFQGLDKSIIFDTRNMLQQRLFFGPSIR